MASIFVGQVLGKLPNLICIHLGIQPQAMEYLGSGLWLLGYWLLWVLLPISAFRPENRFYCVGDWSLRVKRFSLIFGLIALVHLWIILAFAFMWQ
jgi:hypothetical protein